MIFNDWNEYDRFNDVNLIVNGNFPDDIAAWVFYSDVKLEWDAGRVKLSQDKDYRTAYQDVIVEVGVQYKLSADITNGTISGRMFVVESGGNNLGSFNSTTGELAFTSAKSAIKVYMGGLTGSGYCHFDNIKLRPA